MSERFLILDGHSHCYQAYYAITAKLTTHLTENRQMQCMDLRGDPLQKLLREHHPEVCSSGILTQNMPLIDIIVTLNIRQTVNRTPDELQAQIPLIYKVVRAHNIPIYAAKGSEADDVISALVKKLSEKMLKSS